MKVIFSEVAFRQYTTWQAEDKRIAIRINELIKSIQRDGFVNGIGKPEPLKGRKEYSRRIDDYNRLIYLGDANKNLVIISCKGHYKDN